MNPGINRRIHDSIMGTCSENRKLLEKNSNIMSERNNVMPCSTSFIIKAIKQKYGILDYY